MTGGLQASENEHVAPQWMPAGLLAQAVPLPVPVFLAEVSGDGDEAAVTVGRLQAPRGCRNSTPLQPVKVESRPGWR